MNNEKSAKTILLVEDEAIISIIASKALKRFGYNVISAKNGEIAVKLAVENEDIALVLMDINLGDGIDGTEASRQILARRNIPIVFHTSHSEKEMVEKVRGITRYGYVIKNSGDFVLNSTIEMAFDLFDANRITEESMNAMIESEERYHSAFMTSPDSVNINKMNGEYVEINDGFTQLTGYTREDVLGVLSSEIRIWARPDDRVKLIKYLTEEGVVENLESLFRCKDGSLKTALMSARVIKIKDEPHILSITRDISERKQFEETLKTKNEELNSAMEEMEAANEELSAANEELIRTSEELQTNENRFRSVVEKSHVGVAIVDDSSRYIYVNEEFCNITGYEGHEILGKDFSSLLSEESKKLSIERYKSRQRGEDVPSHYEFSFVRKSGEKRYGDVRSAVYYDASGKANSLIQIMDITERKKSDAELRNLNDKFMKIADSIPGYIAYVNAETLQYEFVNVAFEKSFGIPREKIIGNHIKEIIGEKNYQFALKYINEVKKGKSASYENTFELTSGKRWIQVNYSPVFDASGQVTSIAVLSYDMTEQKMVEQSLKESESRYRVLLDLAVDGILLGSHEGIVTDANESMCRITGMNKEDLTGKHITMLPFTPESLNKSPFRFDLIQIGDIVVNDRVLVRPDGSEVVVEMRSRMMPDGTYQSIFRDITERKKIEEELVTSEARFSALMDNFPGLVMIKDAELRPVYVNRRIRELFPVEEWIGKTPEECFPPEVSEPMRENDERAFAERYLQYDEEWVSKDGVTRELETRKFRIERQGACSLLGIIILDITERKHAEDEIRKLLGEKELILKEVHHRIKNNMNTINSLLTLQADSLKDPAAIEALENAGSRVHSMMVLYDKLYQSQEFEEISAADYFPSLVDEVVANFPNSRMVKVEKRIDDFVLEIKKIQPLGIIINELLTNIMKYAVDEKRNVLITVSAVLKDNHALFIVKDNGSGISEAIDFENSPGFGLQLISMLTEQIGGSISIDRSEGTKFVIEFDV